MVQSIDETQRQANALSVSIFDKHTALKQILCRHESLIRQRWHKKNRSQRLSILLIASPGQAIPACHRPELLAYYVQDISLAGMQKEHKRTFTCPQINQEDLFKANNLPLLLNSRGRHHPSAFAAADGDTMRFGQLVLVICPVRSNGATMVLNGVTDNGEYGQLVKWDENEEAAEWIQSRLQFSPGKGLLILEAQEYILKFLVQC